MNVELVLQEGIYDELSILLSKADSMEKASAFVFHFFQKKIAEGVLDMYDFTIVDSGSSGFQAHIEYSFSWNVANTCSALVLPKRGPVAAFDHAMGII